MKSFELIITELERQARTKGRFKDLCSDVFQSPEGAELLALLCSAEHPLDHTPGGTDHQHGRREVIAALWRHGSSRNVIPESDPEPNEPGAPTETDSGGSEANPRS